MGRYKSASHLFYRCQYFVWTTVWKDNKSEGQSFYFFDPDGHKLELHVGDLSSRLAQCREKPYSGIRFGSGK
ncbi:hypothetical protein B9P90_05980 [Citrobacter freundii]|uniref:Fosfomycin resistance protein FosB n=1 Tax=Citrobacter freundii TaxID=546 RepID=A0AA44SLN0_CITFR|nr:hypothetical protein B9P90_05980 [Citrobacter freundii]OYR06144.1 hypothetical protein B9P89_05585 [Citrobacter freundii]